MTGDAALDTDDAEMELRGLAPQRPERFRTWNRKLHYYLGLYLLFFLWLFAVSGLLLNHPKWATGQFWNEREERVTERALRPLEATSDLGIAAELMRQFAIVGEISDIQRAPNGATFSFQVVKPGHVVRVAADMSAGRASVTEIVLNGWGVMDALHKFTGVRLDKPNEQRDWILTRLWSIAMDALSLGLMILVGSGVYLWWRLRGKRAAGLVALTLGVASCGVFLYGFALIG
jgi:hypothetical protein